MLKKQPLDECVKCSQHASFRDGAVMCKYLNREEQRMTQVINNTAYLINCPKNEYEMN